MISRGMRMRLRAVLEQRNGSTREGRTPARATRASIHLSIAGLAGILACQSARSESPKEASASPCRKAEKANQFASAVGAEPSRLKP